MCYSFEGGFSNELIVFFGGVVIKIMMGVKGCMEFGVGVMKVVVVVDV